MALPVNKPSANCSAKLTKFLTTGDAYKRPSLHNICHAVKLTKRESEGIRMTNALRWAGYFAIVTGIIIAIYIISSLKVIDISALDFVAKEAPHPYRWLYAFFVLAVTTPTGLMSVVVAQFIESKSEDNDYKFDAKKRREEITRQM
jgi:hypothetical protein